MKLDKITSKVAAVLGVSAALVGSAYAQTITVGGGPGTNVTVGGPPVVIANNPYYGGYNRYNYSAPVVTGGAYVSGNAVAYNNTAFVGGGYYNAGIGSQVYANGTNVTAGNAGYNYVPVDTVPYSQVSGQLYDPVTDACYTRTDVYNYYTYEVYSGAGSYSSFVGRYTDGPYYQTSYENSYPGPCR